MREHTLQAMPYKVEIHKKAWGHEEGSCIFEVSTQHFDSDSYRVLPGSSQEDNSDNLPF